MEPFKMRILIFLHPPFLVFLLVLAALCFWGILAIGASNLSGFGFQGPLEPLSDTFLEIFAKIYPGVALSTAAAVFVLGWQWAGREARRLNRVMLG